MAKSDLIKNVKTITEQLKKMAAESGNSEQIIEAYKGLINACETLNDTFDSYCNPNQDGTIPLVDGKGREIILKQYQSLANATEKVRELPDADDTVGIRYLSSYIGVLASKDMQGFISLTNPQPLRDILSDSRKTVTKNDQPTEKIGANLSSRQVINYIKNGKEVKGVFTQNTIYQGSEDKWKNLTQQYSSAYPQYADLFERVVKSGLYSSIPIIQGENGFDYGEYVDELPGFSVDNALNNTLSNALLTDPQFSASYYQFVTDCNALLSATEINDNIIGYTKKEMINERNSAMSMVAELLDNRNLLVHSESWAVHNNGITTNGTLMEFAKGVDVANLSADDPFRKIDEKGVDNSSLKEQLANLQIIDYLCGNVDRHLANMLYQVENGKITGIVGIDNDASFPNNIDLLAGNMRNPGLAGLGVIDEKLANKISALTPAMLKMGLRGFNLSNDAIEKSVERLRDLQEVIRNSPVYDGSEIGYSDATATGLQDVKLTIVPTAKWKDIKMDDLAYNKVSYFSSVQEMVKNQRDLSTDIAEFKKDLPYKKAAVVTACAGGGNGLTKIAEELSAATTFFGGSSKLYKDIQKEVKDLSAALKRIDLNYNKESTQDCLKRYATIKGLTEQYIASKQGLNNNAYTQKRLGIITNLDNMLKEGKQNLEEKIDGVEKTERKINEFESCMERNIQEAENANLFERLKADNSMEMAAKEEHIDTGITKNKAEIEIK